MKIFKRNDSITRNQLEAYIGSNAYSPFYSKTLDRFINNPSSVNWNWPCFFLNMYWLMFRKSIIPALAIFIANLALILIIPVPFSGVLSTALLIFLGFFGTNIYLLNAEKEISKIIANNPSKSEDEILDLISKAGGSDIRYAIIFYLLQFCLYEFMLK